MKFISILLVLMALSTTILGQSAVKGIRISNPEITKQLNEIEILQSNGEYKKAISQCENLLEKYPQNSRILDKLIELYENTNNQNKIEKTYNKLIKKFPTQYRLYFKLADLYIENSKINEAKKLLISLLNNVNYNNQISAMVIEKFISLGLNDEIFSIVKKVREKTHNNLFYAFELGNLYDLEGKTEQMLEEFYKFFTIKPKNFSYYKNKEYIKETLKTRSLEDNSFFQKFANFVEKKQNNELLLVYGEVIYKKNDTKRAIEIFEKIDKELKANGRILRNLSNMAMKNNDYKTAIKILNIIEKKYKLDMNYDLAELYESAGIIDSAIYYYNQFLNKNTKKSIYNLNSLYKIAYIYLEHKKDIDSSLLYINKINTVNFPKDLLYKVNNLKIKIYIKKEMFDNAIDLANYMIDLSDKLGFNKGDWIYYIGLVNFYKRLYLNSGNEFQKIIKEYPDCKYYNDLIQQITILTAIGDNLKLLNIYRDAMWFEELFNYDSAFAKYNEILEKYSDFSEKQQIYIKISNILRKLKDYDRMIVFSKQGIEIDSTSFEAMQLYYQIAEYYIQIGEYNKAAELYYKILRSSNGIALKSAVRKKIELLKKKGFIS